jgi:hypothetical protein
MNAETLRVGSLVTGATSWCGCSEEKRLPLATLRQRQATVPAAPPPAPAQWQASHGGQTRIGVRKPGQWQQLKLLCVPEQRVSGRRQSWAGCRHRHRQARRLLTCRRGASGSRPRPRSSHRTAGGPHPRRSRSRWRARRPRRPRRRRRQSALGHRPSRSRPPRRGRPPCRCQRPRHRRATRLAPLARCRSPPRRPSRRPRPLGGRARRTTVARRRLRLRLRRSGQQLHGQQRAEGLQRRQRANRLQQLLLRLRTATVR